MTNWPNGVDSFSDPTPSTAMNNATQSHSAMHALANDAIHAMQSGAGAANGLATIGSSTVRTVGGTNKPTISVDTAANWSANNPVLGALEVAHESDTGVVKHGNGTAAYNSLNPILSGTYGPLQALIAPPAASTVTQGLYSRTTPAPSGESGIAALAVDPNNAGYLWAAGATSGKLGYTTDNGATFTPVIALPNAAGTSVVQCIIDAAWMFLLTTGGGSVDGQVWRSPAPNATGANLAFTKIFDLNGLANGPGGAAGNGSPGTCFRPSCMAWDGMHMYLLTYGGGNPYFSVGVPADVIMGAGSDIAYSPGGFDSSMGSAVGLTCSITGAGAAGATLTSQIVACYGSHKIRLADVARTSVTGATFSIAYQQWGSQLCVAGPELFVSSNAGAASAASVVFSLGKSWPWAKHGHAVRIIGGVPWVSLGDYGWPLVLDGTQPLTEVGLWAATSTAATTWNQITAAVAGGVTQAACIDFLPVTIDGAGWVIGETDGRIGTGPILIPTQSNSGQVTPLATPRLPAPFTQTMRMIGFTPEGNLLWWGTGENGAVGPRDGIWLAKPPFTNPWLLEDLAPNTIQSNTQAVWQGDYVWFGNHRIAREKFIGQ